MGNGVSIANISFNIRENYVLYNVVSASDDDIADTPSQLDSLLIFPHHKKF